MSDIETKQRFVFLRAQGWSFARIAEDLKISKPTLINWSRQFRYEIQNQRAIHIEALQEKWLSALDVRVNALGEQLCKVEAELGKRDMATVPTARLFALVEALRRQIMAETGPMEFGISSRELPREEFFEEARHWKP
jgi:transcriptional regulator with XRE-family HTH domain